MLKKLKKASIILFSFLLVLLISPSIELYAVGSSIMCSDYEISDAGKPECSRVKVPEVIAKVFSDPKAMKV